MKIDKSNVYDHAWRYFELHATQRISLIRYYIIVLSLYVTSAGYLVTKFSLKSCTEEIGVIFFSVILVFLTIIFWFLDNRNRRLIQLAEKSLRSQERSSNLESEHRIFIREQRISRCSIRHTHCFRALFILAIISAVVISLYSSWHICKTPTERSSQPYTQTITHKI